jgi:uncharacterized Zn finger protein (UPF0148 family)
MARLLAIVVLLAMISAPSGWASGFCGAPWYDKAGQLECQLADVRKAQEEIDSAASSRRLMESFPRNEIPPDYRFLQEMKEDRARQQLEDALRH